MPRNGSGTMTAAQTYTTGQTITAAVINSNITDIASEITNSVAKDGQTVMTGQFKAGNGTVGAPSITFGSDLDTGLYRKSANVIGVAIGGVEVAKIDATGGFIPVGAMWQYLATTAPTGWVRANGRTIGNASSSGTERANADTEDLFSFLWTNFADAQCAVSSGRGASAAADYAANKTIALPDLRGRGFFGLDDMGSTAATRLGTVITDETTNGASGGAETTTLSTTHLPSHTHDVVGTSGNQNNSHAHTYSGTTSTTGAHQHTVDGVNAQTAGSGANPGGQLNSEATSSAGDHAHTYSGTTDGQSADHAHAISITSAATGSGTAFSNLPPAWLGTYIIKL